MEKSRLKMEMAAAEMLYSGRTEDRWTEDRRKEGIRKEDRRKESRRKEGRKTGGKRARGRRTGLPTVTHISSRANSTIMMGFILKGGAF